MDPKKLTHLDPKLKEVYERVMGTTVAAPSAQAQPVPAPSAKPSASTAAAPSQPAEPAVMPQVTNPVMATPPMMKKNGLPPAVIIGILIVVFFALYAVFWMWIFKLPLPFNFF